jgi:hypothetical protein
MRPAAGRARREACGAAAVLLMLSACSPSPSGQQDNQAQGAGPAVPPGQVPAAPPAKPFKTSESTALLEFSYAWPAEASAVAPIVDRLRGEMARAKADALKLAQDDSVSAKAGGYPFHAHSLETTWETHASTPRFLSLLGQSYVYTGGAHGMTGYQPLLWDRKAGQEVAFATMLTSPGALTQAAGARFCKALDAERAKKRGAPVVPDEDDDFTACPDMMKQTLVPEAKGGKALDTVKVVIGPYEAGPYAEGSYEIALPVDAAVLDVIKPEYRADFATAP